MRVAAASYPIDWIGGYLGFVEKYRAWVARAAREGAELLVFPDYAAMELACFTGRAAAADLAGAMTAVSEMLPAYWDMCAELARRHGVHILAGSGPCRDGGAWVDRAMFLGPEGGRQPHDKQIATPRERDLMGLSPGGPLTLMETALGRVGVLICHDAEIPRFARALVEAGAQVLLVPSQTATEAGWNRVRIGAMARAREERCFTVQAVTQGQAPWNPVADGNAGAAGIYAPPGDGFPATGVIAQGAENRAGWTFGAVDLARLDDARAAGDARSPARGRKGAPSAAKVETVALA